MLARLKRWAASVAPWAVGVGLFVGLPFVGRAKVIADFGMNESLTLAAGLVLLWYTIETRGMRVEMVEARKRAETPEVVVWLEPITSGFYNLVVRNVSAVPARRLRFEPPLPHLPLLLNQHTDEIGFLRLGIVDLPPGQSHTSYFCNLSELISLGLGHSQVEFRYRYENLAGTEFQRAATFNMEAYWGVTHLAADFESRLVQRLEEIRDAVQGIRGELRPRRSVGRPAGVGWRPRLTAILQRLVQRRVP